MRLFRIDCDRDGVAVLFVLAFPLMVASLIVLVDIGRIEANAPGASAEFLYEGVAPPAEDVDPDEQSEEIDYSYVSGDILIDPEDVEGGSYEALEYLIKESDAEARVGLVATTRVEPLMLGTFIGDGIGVQSFSAAQAFGGSTREFAEQGAEGIDVAEGWVTDDGYDALYRASLVPGWTPGAPGVNH